MINIEKEQKQEIATLEFNPPLFLSKETQIEVILREKGQAVNVGLITFSNIASDVEDRPRLLTDIIFLGKKLPEGWPDEAER